MARFPLLLALPVVMLALMVCPSPADELEDEHALSLEFETPHTDWAQPYALGKTRVLFFSDGRGTKAREIIELMQRFDIEAEAIYWARIVDTTTEQWHGGEAAHRRIARLLEEHWDCYLLHEVQLAWLTAEEQYRLLERVSKGAGIVFVGTGDDRVLKEDNRLAELPPFLEAGGIADAYRVMEGRGVRLPARPRLTYELGWEVEYDYWQERLGRAVLWAAGKEPKVALEGAMSSDGIRRATPADASASVLWSADDNPPVTLDTRLTRDDGTRTGLPAAKGNLSKGFHEVKLPPLRAGTYHLDCFLRSRRGAESWLTLPFVVTSARKIASVSLDRDWGEVGETLSGTVSLEGEALPNEALSVRLVDRRGRIVALQGPPLGNGVPAFSFSTAEWMPMLLRVEALLSDAAGEVSAAHAYYRITTRNRGQFNFLVWDYPRDTLSPYAEEALAELGMTIQLAGGAPPLEVAAYGAAWVPYTTRIMADHQTDGVMAPVCWNDEPAVDEYVQGIADQYAGARAHGVFVYSLGDETVTRGSCAHPACLEAYRGYLREQYGTIAALNFSWGSNYAGFEEVQLLDPADYRAAEALRQRNYPRWYDRQAFECYNFVGFCTRFAKAYSAMDPQARTGFEGAGRLDQGDDFDLIVRTNGFWSPYPGAGDELIRSLAPRDFPRANWMGYTKDADSLLSKYWRMVTRGMDAVWWWRWDNIGRFHGLLMPHLGPFPAIKELMADTQMVRDGLGDWLINAEMQDNGIAILYSLPSAYAVRVEAGPSYGDHAATHEAWHKLIRGLGLQFRYVTDRQLRRGEFDARRHRALILPRAEAFGEEEAEAIRAFVARGGHVIADVRPGIYDAHCKPREQGILDDLFGVERTGVGEAAKTTVAVNPGEWQDPASLRDVMLDPAVKPIGGRAEPWGYTEAGQAAIIRSPSSRGRVTLLNLSVPSLPDIATPDGADVARLFEALLGRDETAQASVNDMRGRPMRDVEVVRWQNGDIEAIALFREAGEQARGRVWIPGDRHCYDLRHRQDLGTEGLFPTTIRPGRASFFVAVPKPFEKPGLELVSSTCTPGDVAELRLTTPDGLGVRPLRVTVKLPGGAAADWAGGPTLVGRQPVSVPIPIALNDPVGKWRIEVLDVFPNRTYTVELHVRGGA